jgi:CRP-like cAMP-binding protein
METWRALAQSGALGKPLHLKDRALLFQRGDPARHAYLLFSGAYEVFQESDQGMSVVVKLVTPPTMPGTVEVIAEEPTYLESIRVAKEATLFRITARRYLELVATNPQAGYEALVDISQCFAGAARFEASRLHDTDVLLATLLSAYAEVFGRQVAGGVRVELKRSQAQLAGAIGCTERSVNRVFTQWKDQGLIAKLAGRYLLKDIATLHRTAGPLRGALVHRWVPPQQLPQVGE